MQRLELCQNDAALLRERGLRATPQRLYMLAVLRAMAGHVTAEAVLHRAEQEMPTLNLATVYRALHDLRGAGLVVETDIGERTSVYELLQRRHHHLVCQECRAVIELEDDALETVKQVLRARYGFEARMDHFAIFGTCAGCSGQVTEAPP